jgi:hypothetical protein
MRVNNHEKKLALLAIFTAGGFAQTAPPALPNPYTAATDNWAKLPSDRPWGGAPAISMDRAGHVWVFE